MQRTALVTLAASVIAVALVLGVLLLRRWRARQHRIPLAPHEMGVLMACEAAITANELGALFTELAEGMYVEALGELVRAHLALAISKAHDDLGRGSEAASLYEAAMVHAMTNMPDAVGFFQPGVVAAIYADRCLIPPAAIATARVAAADAASMEYACRLYFLGEPDEKDRAAVEDLASILERPGTPIADVKAPWLLFALVRVTRALGFSATTIDGCSATQTICVGYARLLGLFARTVCVMTPALLARHQNPHVPSN